MGAISRFYLPDGGGPSEDQTYMVGARLIIVEVGKTDRLYHSSSLHAELLEARDLQLAARLSERTFYCRRHAFCIYLVSLFNGGPASDHQQPGARQTNRLNLGQQASAGVFKRQGCVQWLAIVSQLLCWPALP